MNTAAILGITELIKVLLLELRNRRMQWQQDNPNTPVPTELTDEAIIAGFAEALEGATEKVDAVIARLRQRMANEKA